MRKLLCTALAAGIAVSCALPAQALTGVSPWAAHEISAAQAAGLEPLSLVASPAAKPVTRAEFCEIALNLYEALSGRAAPTAPVTAFTDTASTAVNAAAELGLVTGRGSGVFDPSGAVTRQELCKILSNVLVAAQCPAPPTDLDALRPFSDSHCVAIWATEPVSQMLCAGILHGVSRTGDDPTGETVTLTELLPAGATTREQALLLALRSAETFRPATPAPKPEPAPKPTDSAPKPKPDPDGGEQPVSKPKPDSVPQTKAEKMEFVFGTEGSFFATPVLAEAAMTEIVVPVWRLKDGVKTPDKAYITVNRNLSAIYTAIFIEIYHGSEQFPIADVGCYAWRQSPTSEHRWGTAIDINADANMEATINEDGTLTPTCGTHWSPETDPFSISERGEVYRAFCKYGFTWGGNAWHTKRDYMHFSYFGR